MTIGDPDKSKEDWEGWDATLEKFQEIGRLALMFLRNQGLFTVNAHSVRLQIWHMMETRMRMPRGTVENGGSQEVEITFPFLGRRMPSCRDASCRDARCRDAVVRREAVSMQQRIKAAAIQRQY